MHCCHRRIGLDRRVKHVTPVQTGDRLARRSPTNVIGRLDRPTHAVTVPRGERPLYERIFIVFVEL
jgi:hypothetical protein